MEETIEIQLVTPQWIGLVVLAVVIILFAPRRWVLSPVLVATAFLSYCNHFYIFGNNFFTIRILLVFAWARVLVRGEHRGFQFLPMDKAWIVFCCYLLFTETLQRGLAGTVYGTANYIYEGLGTYFLARILIQDARVFRQVLATVAVICCILAFFLSLEYFTRRNWLAWLGTFFEEVQERGGRLRCQATFAHPVLVGTYGAVLLPLFVASWWQPGMKRLVIPACLASAIMVFTAGSAGPVMTFVAVVGAMLLWPLRTHMRPLRWGLLFMVVALHLVMKAPVWALIARIHISGGTSYHRYALLNSFIEHFKEWWLIGIANTASWGWLMDDVANYFCIVAKHGGLLGLLLFIRVLATGFREVGLRRREAEAVSDFPTEVLVWAFGISIFGHIVSFFGTSYFDQTSVLWHVSLAMIASLSLLTQPQPAVVQEPVAEATGTARVEIDGIPLASP